MSTTSAYISSLQNELSTGSAHEHTYRSAFKTLIESIDQTINAVNEPARSAHGAPDFVFLSKANRDLILGYAETKDLNVDLDQVEKSEQLKRYLGYPNLILTNYLEFRFFRNGEKYQTIIVAELSGGNLKSIELNFSTLEREIKAFLSGEPETIKSAKKLAKIMGGRARRIRENVERFLNTDKDDKSEELFRIYNVMKELLVHDLSTEKFADMYAQTLVYGLFVARFYDKTPNDFSRAEALELVPASNPFLRKFFDHIAGINFDSRLKYIADELCTIFSVSNVPEIMNQKYNLFGETTDKDPIIHFYEDFLFEYDPQLKKQMGAYYTPVPIVQFIIKSVDEVLKKEFALLEGISDTAKIDRVRKIQATKIKETIPRVQILDPAVGTATFLNEVIKFIFKKFENQKGMWKSYVSTELLTRLNGFELMMAPYTIAHLKLALTLKETGIEDFKQRLNVYLTNTLESGVSSTPSLFDFGLVGAITKESEEASLIKQNTPIMVIMGNPPYSGVSSNMTPFANQLVNNYKVEPGGVTPLLERKHWLNDDYVKFISFSETMIEKTGEGVMAMITNHGYLDNPTFRGMRWHLSKTFSRIYILDLHGNSKKKEVSPDGTADKNVFDIQQGVSIIIAIKLKRTQKKLADVYRADVWGSKSKKFEYLNENSIGNIPWTKLILDDRTYSFTLNSDSLLKKEYYSFPSIKDIFTQNSTGIVTMGDQFITDTDKLDLSNRIKEFITDEPVSEETLTSRYHLGKNYSKWALSNKQKGMEYDEQKLVSFSYRPFDDRYIYYDPRLVWRPRNKIMKNFINNSNIGLVSVRQVAETSGFNHVFVSSSIVESRMTLSNKGICYYFPLYIYSSEPIEQIIHKTSNLNTEKIKLLLSSVGDYDRVTPDDIFNYIYASLHSTNYRKKYKDFLKSDFPRIPPPKNSISFWKLTKLGNRLRNLHLLDEVELGVLSTNFPVQGTNEIEKVSYKEGKIYINSTQYFDGIDKDVFDFCIGGYKPADKWLKDRKNTKLVYDDILHYQKIIASQEKTIKTMMEIDKILS